MERHCLNCVWLNKEKMHCDYEFGTSRYKPDFLDDDNNFIDDNEELIQDINILEDFRCHKYYERPPKIINPIALLQDYKNMAGKIKEYIKTELKERYWDIDIIDDDEFLLCFRIDIWDFDISLINNYISVEAHANNICFEGQYSSNLETFDELFKYIDDVISEED